MSFAPAPMHEDRRGSGSRECSREDSPNGEIKQKNEGGWEFYWDEESRPGVVVLEVRVQKFLDSSLIDVDVHPTYVSMIIKSKVRYGAMLCRWRWVNR